MTGAPDAVLALDIGGGHVTAALISLDTRTVSGYGVVRISVDHNADAGTIVHAWSVAALHALRDDLLPPTHVVVAMPGPFDYESGVSTMKRKFRTLHGLNVRSALQTAWQDTPLAEATVLFGNDATLFALGEWWAGAARGVRRVVGVTLGTGIGGGFVVDGVPQYGGEGVPDGGMVWHLPLRGGVAEDFVSGPALTWAYERRTGSRLSPAAMAAAAQAGDRDAQAVFIQLGQDLAEVLSPCLSAFRAERLVLGGNISRAFTLFQGSIRLGLRAGGVLIVPTSLFETAALLGGAALYASNSAHLLTSHGRERRA